MSQSRLASLTESLANICIGYLIAVAAQIAIFPLFGIQISTGDNFAIAGLFTAVSLVRSYVLRRVFNYWSGRK